MFFRSNERCLKKKRIIIVSSGLYKLKFFYYSIWILITYLSEIYKKIYQNILIQ